MMKENIVPSLKLLFKPLIMYYGEWDLNDNLKNISLLKNNKSLFEEFLERYYYMPLKVIFKDEELVKSFKYGVCSRLNESGRNLYFSKKAFLRTVISNVDDIVENNGDAAYKDIKKAIRIKKDIYRDVDNNGEASDFYEDVKNEYLSCELDISLEEFISLCKKKYTRLLNGYNAVLELFNKPINLDKFISCFDPDQLYLFTCYSLLNNSKRYFDLYGKADYNIVCLDSYKQIVDDARRKDSFYNSHITLDNNGEVVIYTIDDLFRDYEEFLEYMNR
ncbi:MAG: hypothetical protein IJ475_02095 [Bacilli bacterium]|nr:hypothetical protein [Bacilli bacterium]